MSPYQALNALRKLATENELNSDEVNNTEEFLLSEKFAHFLDSKDELSSFREQFYIPCKDLESDPKVNPTLEKSIYFCGNSLGLQPKRVEQYLEEELSKWRSMGVEGHFLGKRPWATADEHATPLVANLVGTSSDNVAVMNTLTANIHLLMISFFKPTLTRNKIMIEHSAFCSDYHLVKSQLKYHGLDPETHLISVKPREGEYFLRTEDILKKIEEEGDSVAVILFPGIQFYTGQFFDIKAIAEAGHKKGCYVGFDLAHAFGNVPVELEQWNVDFAAWCTYKYLNSGPGAIAGIFVHPKHKNTPFEDLPRLTGWWGQQITDRFSMKDLWVGKQGAQSWQISNPPITTLASFQAAVEVTNEAGLPKMRNKSKFLTAYLEAMCQIVCGVDSIEDENSELTNIKQITPRDPNARGCQISLLFPYNVDKVNAALIKNGIVCDVRKPNVIRVAPTPLYNTFSEVYAFVHALKAIISSLQ